jgi:hypothetical protein
MRLPGVPTYVSIERRPFWSTTVTNELLAGAGFRVTRGKFPEDCARSTMLMPSHTRGRSAPKIGGEAGMTTFVVGFGCGIAATIWVQRLFVAIKARRERILNDRER